VIGDVALVLKSGGNLYALGALNAEPSAVPPPDPDDDPPPFLETVRSRTFRPLFTGTYRGGWRGDTNALYQGDWTGRGRNFGAAYYGSGPSSLTGTAVSATLRYKRLTGGVYGRGAPTLRLLEHRNRPGGFPAFSRSIRGAGVTIGDTVTVNLPLSWAAALLAGTAGGIGIGVSADAPYIQLAGRSAWGPAMELTIRWRP
jgi:hypothetical protein